MDRIMRTALAVALAVVALMAFASPAASSPVREVPLDGWTTDGTVYDIAVSDTTVYIAGSFSAAIAPDGTTTPRSDLAAFDRGTGALLPFAPTTNGVAWALATDGSTVWVGGFFSTVNGTTRQHLAAVDATTGALVPGFSVGMNGGVRGLTRLGTSLYAGGDFTAAGGTSHIRVSKHDAVTGAVDHSFTASANGRVFSLAAAPGGDTVYLAGEFNQLNGNDHAFLAGVSAATGTVTATFDDSDYRIREIDITDDGAHIAAALAGPSSGNLAATWEVATGDRLWTQRAMGDNQAIAIRDGIVFFAFHEGFEGDESVRLLAADLLTGALLPDFRPGIDTFFGIWAIAAVDDGVYIGGEFTAVSGVDRATFAFFPADATAPATPTGLAAPSVTASTASLTWDPVVDDDVGLVYEILQNGSVTGTTVSPFFTAHGLQPGATNDFTVRATDSAGNTSTASASLPVTTLPGADTPTATSVIVEGDLWRYDDSGARIGRSWRPIDFDDSGWPVGPSELGYGDGDEATQLTTGRVTGRFRREISLDGAPADDATVLVRYDDGVAVYINGTEIYRDNLNTGAGARTSALSTTTDEDAWIVVTAPGGLLRSGANVIAAEVHNRSGSSDLSFSLELSLPTVGTAPGLPAASAGDTTVEEGASVAAITVSLAGSSTEVTSAAWTTVAATARPGDDYVASSGIVEFQPGDTVATIEVALIDDDIDEADETFSVVLDSPIGLVLADAQATVTVTDDDGQPNEALVVIPGAAAILEGDIGKEFVDIPVRLSEPATTTVTVDWATIDVPSNPAVALGDVDYRAVSGTLTFDPGSTEEIVRVKVFSDLVPEPPLLYGEWGFVSFTNPSPGVVVDTSFFGLGLFVIVDDD